MGIAFFTFDSLLSPLHRFAHGFVQWFLGSQPRTVSQPAPIQRQRVAELPVQKPLRVVRVMDSTQRPGAGRMVISGRMADVCAELDRLAALEAAGC